MAEQLKSDPNKTVYVRPVALADLPEELQEQAPEGLTPYAVHDAQGNRLAIVKDRKLAFLLARQHDMTPVYIQ